MNAKMISPTGKLMGVFQAVPVVENVFTFNGRVQRLRERAHSCKGVKPNAISISTESGANPMFQSELLVGNLKAEKVNMIMKSLLVHGYYDFTDMKFQTARTESELVFDNGATLPYASDITVMINQNFCYHDNFGSPFNMSPLMKDTDAKQMDDSNFMNEPDDDYDYDVFDEEGDEEEYDEFGGGSYE